MPTISFGGLWINLAADLSKSMYLPYGDSYAVQPVNRIDTVIYAAGNIRKTRQPGTQRQVTVNLQAVTAVQRNLLELPADMGGWLGETVCLRDFRGRKMHGWWDPPQIAEHRYNGECDVQLSFQSLTFSEAV